MVNLLIINLGGELGGELYHKSSIALFAIKYDILNFQLYIVY
jgi:hypothetical protein